MQGGVLSRDSSLIVLFFMLSRLKSFFCRSRLSPLRHQGTAAGAKAHEAVNWLEKRIDAVPSTDEAETTRLAIMCLQHVSCR